MHHPTPPHHPKPHHPKPHGHLVVDKKVDKRVVRIGGKVHFTIYVRNIGKRPLLKASFVDNLTDVRHHARIVGAIHASSGRVALKGNHFRWTGWLKPGASARITFTVKTHRRGWMHNWVTWGPPPGHDHTSTRIVPRHVK
ncbi:MAG: hypothetical protein ACRD0P_33690 [Stackebrandtia sp.]